MRTLSFNYFASIESVYMIHDTNILKSHFHDIIRRLFLSVHLSDLKNRVL